MAKMQILGEEQTHPPTPPVREGSWLARSFRAIARLSPLRESEE